jgi:hypothetical protein
MTQQKLLRFIKKNPLALSLALHFTLVLTLLLVPAKVPNQIEHLSIQTVQLIAPSPPPQKIAPIKKQVAPKQKKTAPKKAPAKKVPVKKPPKPTLKKTQNPKSTNQKKTPSNKNAQAIKKAAKSSPSLLPATSHKSLLQMLQTRLELPELGKVTLELTLSAKGALTQVKILSSDSKKNEAYLLLALKKISFAELKLTGETCVVVEFGNERGTS